MHNSWLRTKCKWKYDRKLFQHIASCYVLSTYHSPSHLLATLPVGQNYIFTVFSHQTTCFEIFSIFSEIWINHISDNIPISLLTLTSNLIVSIRVLICANNVFLFSLSLFAWYIDIITSTHKLCNFSHKLYLYSLGNCFVKEKTHNNNS